MEEVMRVLDVRWRFIHFLPDTVIMKGCFFVLVSICLSSRCVKPILFRAGYKHLTIDYEYSLLTRSEEHPHRRQ
jgi:hypothetical protein